MEFVFVVKVSKFCNLRCAYCYEHRELHVRDVMSAETLASLFDGVDAFGDYLRGRGIAPSFSFVWHGGEPLLLAPEYYRRVAEMQGASIRRYRYRNSLQTNLYGFNKNTLEFVLASDWELGVSIDFASGIRRNTGGRGSNERVIANAEALCTGGGRFGLISVLGKHNRATLVDAYDWAAEFAEGWRILPLFAGGPEEATAELQLSPNEVAEVFAELFRKRANSARHLPIAPLDDYTKASALRIVDQPGTIDIGRALLDNIFVINVNGEVFTRPFAYDTRYCLGNIARHSMQQMLEGEAYKICQQAILRKKQASCTACDFRRYCDSSPMHEHGSIARDNGVERCGTPHDAIAAIHAELTGAGVDASVVGEWAREWLMQPHAAVA
ncbi:MAG TPA: radical SAM protein [Rhizomicrobium sp.]|nr:radical SAM protein [Rhizomicrobium sp.]